MEIHEAAGGFACLDRVTKQPYDLIFLDQPIDLRNGLISVAAVDHRRTANNATKQIRNSNAGSRIAVIDSHYFHKCDILSQLSCFIMIS
mgnify:CR=1 FL=1